MMGLGRNTQFPDGHYEVQLGGLCARKERSEKQTGEQHPAEPENRSFFLCTHKSDPTCRSVTTHIFTFYSFNYNAIVIICEDFDTHKLTENEFGCFQQIL